MSLPEDVLARIYRGDLTRLAGAAPKPLDVAAAIEECERLASLAEAMSGQPAEGTQAARVARALADD
jgi:hypothetical protein